MSDDTNSPLVRVTENGPYEVHGALPLSRTAQVETEYGEPIAWAPDVALAPDVPLAADEPVRLCRCGTSSTKPFCDDSHLTNGFDGTETASHARFEERRYPYEGDGVTIDDDASLCTQAGYCGDRFANVWAMLAKSSDPEVRERIRHMSMLCPSGRIVTRVEGGEPDEIAYEPSVAVIADGPIWVRGGVTVVGADGEPYEVRNRQTLCRCGASRNKPFCDGRHKRTGFSDA
jgi:CDGSH-type Zn-finger protein